ncbi:hypothetical protein DPMN_111752 [Dreissena polymorpha]|uniref:Uncharacterized protein n=1 Tax=Dreissena polymorpha TaxID=45954 RepID=A0A9D4KF51_DREPO|nr:hypothetical protein DPMN_111752 [Dreissena polymorpha]
MSIFRNLNAKCDGRTDRQTDRQSNHYITVEDCQKSLKSQQAIYPQYKPTEAFKEIEPLNSSEVHTNTMMIHHTSLTQTLMIQNLKAMEIVFSSAFSEKTRGIVLASSSCRLTYASAVNDVEDDDQLSNFSILCACPNPGSWTRLAKATMCRLYIFNIRRIAEVEDMLLEAYQNRPEWTGTEEFRASLSDTEKFGENLNNNSAAEGEFGISEKLVRDWRKNKDTIIIENVKSEFFVLVLILEVGLDWQRRLCADCTFST